MTPAAAVALGRLSGGRMAADGEAGPALRFCFTMRTARESHQGIHPAGARREEEEKRQKQERELGWARPRLNVKPGDKLPPHLRHTVRAAAT